jgi:hypothetical protein
VSQPSKDTSATQATDATAVNLPRPASVEPLPPAASTGAEPAEPLRDARGAIQLSPAHGSFASEVHQYIQGQIVLADQKAAFMFAASTALLAFLHNAGATLRWLKVPSDWSVADGLSLVAMAALAATSALSILTIYPRLKGVSPGLFFWKAISTHPSAADYVNAVGTASPERLIEVHLSHCHELAVVCNSKYRALHRAFIAALFGFGASLLYLLFTGVPVASARFIAGVIG